MFKQYFPFWDKLSEDEKCHWLEEAEKIDDKFTHELVVMYSKNRDDFYCKCMDYLKKHYEFSSYYKLDWIRFGEVH